MRYLTIEQREMLQAWLNFRSALLRREIAGALRRSGGEAAISLANHLEEIDDEAVADLESSIEIAEIERDVRELREVELARAPARAGLRRVLRLRRRDPFLAVEREPHGNALHRLPESRGTPVE